MLTIAKVDLPISLRKRLQEEAAFSDSFNHYTTENLIGFRQPVATAVAVVGPILFAFIYYVTDFLTLVEVAGSFALSAAAFLLGGWYVNRHGIRDSYQRHTKARKNAKANLRSGVGESVALTMKTAPVFYEHEHGVICLAAAGEGKTLYFNIDSFENDPRWFIYINGDMHRPNWRWIKLMGSGAVAEFEASGQRMAKIGDTPYVEAPDAWEAISIALGEPEDGAIVEKPLEDVTAIISRLI